MRKLYVFIALLISLFANGQSSEKSEFDGYYESLKLHIEYMELIKYNLDTIYIRKEKYLNDYSGKINSVQVKMIDNEEIHKRTRRENSIIVYQIKEVSFENAVPIIHVDEYDISRKNQQYHLVANNRSVTGIFYDCNNNKYYGELIR